MQVEITGSPQVFLGYPWKSQHSYESPSNLSIITTVQFFVWSYMQNCVWRCYSQYTEKLCLELHAKLCMVMIFPIHRGAKP
jgi:hypothetical protein